MTEFLAQNNACGQSLLQIVATGNSVIAEILRLKDYIPDVYRLSTKAEQLKYEEIILDFSYFKIAEAQELRIEQNEEIRDLDNELRENYLDLLTRFYLAFESAHQYAVDLRDYVNELNRDYYIQQTLESVLQDGEGKQLMCEALYLFGVMLLLIDYHIPGVVRERLLIAYYRYSSASTSNNDSNIDDVCMLLRSTGFVNHCTGKAVSSIVSGSSKTNAKHELTNYPESYFSRFTFDSTFVEMVIGRLRCDDVYNQIAVYPLPEHRTTALANQAAMLYVCLYFLPRFLHTQVPLMREIVDKFFADNWVVCIYMGITVNLYDAWYHFKAARSALEPVLDTTTTVKGLCDLHREKMKKTQKQAYDIVREGMLTDDLILQHTTRIVQLIRQCNVLLRWCLVHATRPVLELSPPAWPKLRQVEQFIQRALNDSNMLFELLINSSQLELDVKEILRALIADKAQRCDDYKKEATERIKELTEAFSGNRSLSKIESNPQLKFWFAEILKEIEKLELKENPSVAGRMLVQLIQALEDVQEFHNLRTNMHVKQYLLETCDYLRKMMQIINIKEDVLVKIQLISDFSYAWCLVDRDFTNTMQESVKRQPKSVIRLRATFLKLASALEIPLLRINQAKSEDLVSVSDYYSSELANYIRKVLQIIPESMFRTLARIVQLQTEVLQEFPTRLEKEKLKSFAQFDDRYTIAKLTHSIAIFTEGILMMKRTLVGVIELNPKQLLEDGIRKELVRHLANALNVGLIIAPRNSKSKQTNAALELESKLTELAKTMNGYRRSFEYVQDYLSVHGLKILQEELKRIIYFNVERECNVYSRQKIQNWQSTYQSDTIPIPTFPPLKDDPTASINFVGRLAREILHCTDASSTIYLELKATWYEKRAPHKVLLVAQNFFNKLCEAISPAGLVGLNRLYSVMILHDLGRNLERVQNNLTSDKMWLDALTELSRELEAANFPAAHLDAPLKYYASYHNRWLKVWPTLLDWLQKLGQMQILRQHLAFELQRSGKCNAKNLESALETFNGALLIELSNAEACERINNTEGNSNSVLKDLSDHLTYFGFYEPMKEVFLHTKNSQHMALFWCLFTIACLPRWHYSENTQTLLAKNPKDTIDFGPHIVGLLTVMQQFHHAVKLAYLAYLCQFVAALVESNLCNTNELSHDAVITLHYLHAFMRAAELPSSLLKERLPEIVLNHFEYLAASSK